MPKQKRLTQEQRQKKRKDKEQKQLQLMIDTLEKTWKQKVNYTCIHCLKIAYNSVVIGTKGCVTDEENL